MREQSIGARAEGKRLRGLGEGSRGGERLSGGGGFSRLSREGVKKILGGLKGSGVGCSKKGGMKRCREGGWLGAGDPGTVGGEEPCASSSSDWTCSALRSSRMSEGGSGTQGGITGASRRGGARHRVLENKWEFFREIKIFGMISKIFWILLREKITNSVETYFGYFGKYYELF